LDSTVVFGYTGADSLGRDHVTMSVSGRHVMKSSIGFIAVTVLLLAGCSSVSVNYDYDHDADFRAFTSYDWMQGPTVAVGDARAAQTRNTLLDQRIRKAVDGQLVDRGLKQRANPDLLVVYHIGVEDKINVTDWGYTYGSYYWGWGGRAVDVYQYQEGTLIIDLINAKTEMLVWRGWATKTLEDNPSPEKAEYTINSVVEKIFRDYPPNKGRRD
jgi:hypothetical protein